MFAARCRAALPAPAAKDAAWKAMMTDAHMSSYQLWALAEGFWQPEQLELTEPYVDRFFAEIPEVAALRGDLTVAELVRFLFPRYAASPRTLESAQVLLRRTDIPLPLRRRVVDCADDLSRVVEARAAERPDLMGE
jgi:aminopeptidase N